MALLVILPTVYGGIHLAAWNFDFATNVEYLLWKVAAIIIMGGFCAVAVLSNLNHYYWLLHHRLPHWIRINIIGNLYCILFVLLVIFYFLSRTYLVVESFISLRHVPIGAYAAVPWVEAIPHI